MIKAVVTLFHQVDQPGQLLVPLQLAHVACWRLPGQTSSNSASQPEPQLSVVIHLALLSPVVVVQHLALLLRLDPPLPWSPAERPQPLVAAHRVLPRDPAVVRALAGAGERQQEEPPHGNQPGGEGVQGGQYWCRTQQAIWPRSSSGLVSNWRPTSWRLVGADHAPTVVEPTIPAAE